MDSTRTYQARQVIFGSYGLRNIVNDALKRIRRNGKVDEVQNMPIRGQLFLFLMILVSLRDPNQEACNIIETKHKL